MILTYKHCVRVSKWLFSCVSELFMLFIDGENILLKCYSAASTQ